jgi:hypothetical protein
MRMRSNRSASVPSPHVVSAVASFGNSSSKSKSSPDDHAPSFTIELCRMRMLAYALVTLSAEAAPPHYLRTAAAAVVAAAIKFMRASAEIECAAARCDGADSSSTAESGQEHLENDVHASVVALMRLPQLIMLFEELLVMYGRDRAGWQRAAVAVAQNLCSRIDSSRDAVCVLLLLLYHSPALDVAALLDVCFPRLLSKCPQVHAAAVPAIDALRRHLSLQCAPKLCLQLTHATHNLAGV